MDKEFAFQNGLNQVPFGKVREIRKELMGALNITSHPAWLRRLRGEVSPKTTEIRAVNEVFRQYGVTKNIWGE